MTRELESFTNAQQGFKKPTSMDIHVTLCPVPYLKVSWHYSWLYRIIYSTLPAGTQWTAHLSTYHTTILKLSQWDLGKIAEGTVRDALWNLTVWINITSWIRNKEQGYTGMDILTTRHQHVYNASVPTTEASLKMNSRKRHKVLHKRITIGLLTDLELNRICNVYHFS